MATLRLTLTADEDVWALCAYRVVLREIVAMSEENGEAWKDDPVADLAREVLKTFPGKAA